MKIECPSCEAFIPAAQMNVAADTAVCETCDGVFQLSAMVAAGGASQNFDIDDRPHGVTLEQFGNHWELTASTRSKMAFFLVPFMCVWSGFSLGGIYGSQLMEGKVDIIMSLFGIPFVLGTLIFGTLALLTVCGKLVITIDRDQGSVFFGIGPVGYSRRFNWFAVDRVDESISYNEKRQPTRTITLTGQSKISFGSLLSEERRYYVVQALRKLLAERRSNR